ncbi:hypothetical protein [Mesorhizobium sp. M2A.F.Ca.ET.042.01.1.1]|uniref:hypothetical protein n=1 Tax=Mesorhizobium sp. M2A.F.Ca.ET.042.01.1.1 TaxID=2496745 RepID=UPI001FE1822E|nr:hypothetical protein [Mesorhizobium sp. M2A.F.Ca.ET.042.01.1.1]
MIYQVSNETELRNAINAANADGDPSSSIVMTQNISVLAPNTLPTPTKSLSIDTQGFTLSGTGVGTNLGSVTFTGGAFTSGTVTISGTLAGGNQVGTSTPAGSGLVFNSGVTTVGGTTAQLVNSGSITGGAASTIGRGGLGVSITNVVTFVNNGTVSGGAGVSSGAGNTGSGVNLFNGGTVINNASGIIQGGNGQVTGSGGAGVFIRGIATAPSTFTNFGTVRGGSVVTGTGNAAVLGRGTLSTVENFGTLEGGNGAAAIAFDTSTWDLTVINDGTIRAGTGSATAILFGQNATSDSILELHAGSQITATSSPVPWPPTTSCASAARRTPASMSRRSARPRSTRTSMPSRRPAPAPGP